MDSRINQYQENDIETLSERLGSLKIIKKDASDRTTKTMSIVPALAVHNK